MTRLECLPALRTLATTCAGVREGEQALVVTDTAGDQEIVGAMASVLEALGLAVVVVSSAPAALPGDEPPSEVSAAMLEADVVFELTSVFIGSCPARRQACEQGARYLTVPGLSWTTLRPGGPFAADFHEIGERAKLLAERFGSASEFRLTSPRGTDLRGSFDGRRGRPLWGIADAPGGYAAPPDIEVGREPGRGHGRRTRRRRRLAPVSRPGPAREPGRAPLHRGTARRPGRARSRGGSPTLSSVRATSACGTSPRCRSG